MKKYTIVGMMSGTSLDGIDLVEVLFQKEDPTDPTASTDPTAPTDPNNPQWSYNILNAESIPYSNSWKSDLSNAHKLSGLDLTILDSRYGHLVGLEIQKFIQKHKSKPDAIAIHGHTVFHQPENNITLQIGNGAEVAAICKIPVVSKFRDKDVALCGQGAPLVPIGDILLFGNYTYCLNLGGIANISYKDFETNNRVAFDITTCNMVLNALSELLSLDYDKDGIIASQGNIIESLKTELNALELYKISGPKSIGREWYELYQLPLNKKYIDLGFEVKDILRTYIDHISFQIGQNCKLPGKMLLTGGGAFNKFLVEQIQLACKDVAIDTKSNLLIEYKEALIFAFLGLLRIEGQNNCLCSVTGALSDNIGGCIFAQ